MKILIAPDKFKGSLTANDACCAIEAGLRQVDPSIEIIKHPLADGGEGTLEVLSSAMELEKVVLTVSDPLFRPVEAYYLKNNDSAFIEMAQASGLQLLHPSEQNPLHTSSYGTGELIKDAVSKGVQHIFLLIGGSATNDAGFGMVEALGISFFSQGKRIHKVKGKDLRSIDGQDLNKLIDLSNVRITVLSDVKNTLYGEQGAAFVYGEQKGASQEELKKLDNGLRNIAERINNGFEKQPGAGAAGGLGYGALTFLDAELKSGIETMLEITDFRKLAEQVDWVITGEGKVDAQTLEGKVVAGVAQIASEMGAPLSVVCGFAENAAHAKTQLKAHHVAQIMDLAKNEKDAMENAKMYLSSLSASLFQDFLRK